MFIYFIFMLPYRYKNMINIEKIKDLEEFYTNKIWDVITSDSFINDLKKIELYIQNHYAELDRDYQIKNKLKIAAERLLSFYLLKNIDVVNIYPSPLSSDIAFFTKDCLLNIDAKTIDLSGNRNDDSYIQFQPHQVNFNNKILFSRQIGEYLFSGIKLKPGLPEIEPNTQLPCLTYFVGITYTDDGKSFCINHIKISCIPNGKIIEKEFNNDIIQNFKTYRYLKVDAAAKINSKYLPKNTNIEIPENWIAFKLNDGSGSNTLVDTWLDISLKNPFDSSEFAIWRIVDKKYHICLGGDSTRILPSILENRENSSKNTWLGVRKKNILN